MLGRQARLRLLATGTCGALNDMLQRRRRQEQDAEVGSPLCHVGGAPLTRPVVWKHHVRVMWSAPATCDTVSRRCRRQFAEVEHGVAAPRCVTSEKIGSLPPSNRTGAAMIDAGRIGESHEGGRSEGNNDRPARLGRARHLHDFTLAQRAGR
jgi:hypothetical protein